MESIIKIISTAITMISEKVNLVSVFGVCIVIFAIKGISTVIGDLYGRFKEKRLTYDTERIDARDEKILLEVYNPLYKKYYKFGDSMRYPLDKVDELHRDLEMLIHNHFDLITPELYRLHANLGKQMSSDYKEGIVRAYFLKMKKIHVQTSRQITARLILQVIINESTLLRKKLHYPYASKKISKYIQKRETTETAIALLSIPALLIYGIVLQQKAISIWSTIFVLLIFGYIFLGCLLVYYRHRTRHTGI